MRRTLILIAAAALLTFGIATYVLVGNNKASSIDTACPQSAPRSLVLDGNIHVCVLVADTTELRRRGLGGREGLAQNEGMLFVFSSTAKHGFWMKDMRFSIDILWLSSEGSIVDAEESISPDTYPNVYVPVAPALYALELPAGFMKEHGLQVGDIVHL